MASCKKKSFLCDHWENGRQSLGFRSFSCGYPGSPSHSIITFNTETVQTGTVATYRCDPGFDLLGPIRRLCVENGTWIPIGIPVCVMNVAAGKAAMQSSIFSKGVPQKAVDGTTSRTYGSDTCTLTEVEDTPWWYVNLLEPFLVQLVRVDFGRSCCANGVPATVIVRVGNSRPDLSANPICNRFSGKIEEGRPLFFPCTSTVTGAFVSVHVETPTQFSLSICETFVYTDQVVPVEQCPEFDQEAATVATYNGKCYLFYSSNPRTLDSATKFCALQGGSLIHDTSPALQGFLSWELYKRHRKNPGSDYWNGVIRKTGSKDWKWVDGKDVTISFWSHPPKEGNCSRFDGKNGWLWSDTDCLNEFNYICEHRPAICGKPERPVNSTLMVRANTVGSTIEYQCNPGHLLLGPSTRTCQPTGFFSEFAPKCSSKTAAHLFAMDAMRLSIRLWGILFHSSRSAISKSRTVAGGLGHAAMRRPSMSQTCSIGFRSGEHAGHYIRCIVSASSMFSTRRALCGRALSSWKTKESPMATA
ncbi:sushi, von Willebrand factor type A, EGF and pentraxin domain-containing protein 1 [Trichonephila clavipes]|nr:sushi, von Willebrand factor type A, EGF and pentraxin domain-containing protein 1 [Trichonephila clavipes]